MVVTVTGRGGREIFGGPLPVQMIMIYMTGAAIYIIINSLFPRQHNWYLLRYLPLISEEQLRGF